MSDELLETVKDGVAVLTMNRPDRLNAMSGEMLDAMLASSSASPPIPTWAWWC